ncbi:hypothetical protein [Limnohabitans sp. Jir72]|uniref:hypothetical protein n=1 Tax=Limnohabitans sp. Jir72 TaxID=1977909 RepID=UPI0011B25B86|nr:hypothetical protein [Limnohabitans sp. Jir72]
MISINRYNILAFLFLIPLAFDFKGQYGGIFIQYLITFIVIVIGVYLCAKLKIKNKSNYSVIMTFIVIYTIIGGFLCFLVNDVLFENYIRVTVNWILFGLGLFVAMRYVNIGKNDCITSGIYAGGVISVLFTSVYGFISTGLNIGEVRYQILSPVILIVEALLIHNIFVERKKNLIDKFILFLCFVLQLFSVTRSHLLAFVLILILALWVTYGSLVNIVHKDFSGLIVFLLAILIGSAILQYIYPELINRWFIRILSSYETYGSDITTLTRLAEIKDQLNKWDEGILTILFGKGYGAYYGWDSVYDSELSYVFNISDLNGVNEFMPGHNLFVYTLFAGGLFFGLPFTFFIIYIFIKSLIFMNKYRYKIYGNKTAKPFTIGLFLVFASLSITIGGNPLGPRYSALLFGVGMGMLVSGFTFVKSSNHKYNSWG